MNTGIGSAVLPRITRSWPLVELPAYSRTAPKIASPVDTAGLKI